MPLMEGETSDKQGYYRYGNSGHAYTWKTERQRRIALQKSIKQAYAIAMSQKRRASGKKRVSPVHIDTEHIVWSSDDYGTGRSSRSSSSSSVAAKKPVPARAAVHVQKSKSGRRTTPVRHRAPKRQTRTKKSAGLRSKGSRGKKAVAATRAPARRTPSRRTPVKVPRRARR